MYMPLKSIFAIIMTTFACSAAQGHGTMVDGKIIGPPSQDLRRNLAAAANDYLRDLPVVKGSEISDEIALPGARKMHAVCVRWRSSGRARGNPGLSPMFVTITGGWLAETAWRNDPRCRDPRLRYHPFPEMR
ncbi:hypothetical protein [Sphingomonas sp.]|uniref:hypothetical protein n=1 Tax=Sphingomonas sp. TaxID=28214 RepID=UPI003D6D2C58